MILKNGVQVLGLRPELLLAIMVADGVYTANGQELVITGITDGQHSKTSRHYLGVAADLRTRYFKADEKKKVANELRERLGKDYLVLEESTHIHLSWKPSRP